MPLPCWPWGMSRRLPSGAWRVKCSIRGLRSIRRTCRTLSASHEQAAVPCRSRLPGGSTSLNSQVSRRHPTGGARSRVRLRLGARVTQAAVRGLAVCRMDDHANPPIAPPLTDRHRLAWLKPRNDRVRASGPRAEVQPTARVDCHHRGSSAPFCTLRATNLDRDRGTLATSTETARTEAQCHGQDDERWCGPVLRRLNSPQAALRGCYAEPQKHCSRT
jgi:hypothetical protein